VVAVEILNSIAGPETRKPRHPWEVSGKFSPHPRRSLAVLSGKSHPVGRCLGGSNPLQSRLDLAPQAEGVRFEPTSRLATLNGFPSRSQSLRLGLHRIGPKCVFKMRVHLAVLGHCADGHGPTRPTLR